MSYYHIGSSMAERALELIHKKLDGDDKTKKGPVTKALDAAKGKVQQEAAKGARAAVTPMVMGVGAVAALALVVALKK